jgi:6-phosphogluconolactonase
MTPASKAVLEIFTDPETLSVGVADWILELAKATSGTFSIVLSGGSTPQGLYRRLAEPPYRDAFPWSRVHFFWGDERFVPHDDVRSNYRMVREALLAHVPVPTGNVHRILTEGIGPEAAASAYEHELKSFYGAEQLDPMRPLFDVVLLGLGEDGHTASLFPGDGALDERDRWVTAVVGAKSESRITLTYPALESCRHAAFLVEGEQKREIFSRVRSGDRDLPAARFRPPATLNWFLDRAAAGPETLMDQAIG